MTFWFLKQRDELRSQLEAMTAAFAEFRETSEQEYAEIQHDREMERVRRIAAETLAAERKTQLEATNQMMRDMMASRDLAQHDRLKSLDLVNTSLLKQLEPEAPVKLPDSTHMVQKRRHQAMDRIRQADSPAKFYKQIEQIFGKRKSETVAAAVAEEIVN